MSGVVTGDSNLMGELSKARRDDASTYEIVDLLLESGALGAEAPYCPLNRGAAHDDRRSPVSSEITRPGFAAISGDLRRESFHALGRACRSAPGEERAMTTVVTYRVLLREGEDATEYTLELTYKSLVRPKPGGGPYLSQEGDTFFAETVEGETI